MVLLPKIGASCIEKPPISASGATKPEDEATSVVFGAILIMNSVEKIEKRKKRLKAFLKFLKFWMQSSTEKKSV